VLTVCINESIVSVSLEGYIVLVIETSTDHGQFSRPLMNDFERLYRIRVISDIQMSQVIDGLAVRVG
jgi:hypothetical protein